jgi:hypothetical protein
MSTSTARKSTTPATRKAAAATRKPRTRKAAVAPVVETPVVETPAPATEAPVAAATFTIRQTDSEGVALFAATLNGKPVEPRVASLDDALRVAATWKSGFAAESTKRAKIAKAEIVNDLDGQIVATLTRDDKGQMINADGEIVSFKTAPTNARAVSGHVA